MSGYIEPYTSNMLPLHWVDWLVFYLFEDSLELSGFFHPDNELAGFTAWCIRSGRCRTVVSL
jgi:hypothetical protein